MTGANQQLVDLDELNNLKASFGVQQCLMVEQLHSDVEILTDVLQPEVEAISVLHRLDALSLHAQVLADQLVRGGDLVLLQDRNGRSANAGNLTKVKQRIFGYIF